MLKLKREQLNADWEAAGIRIPKYEFTEKPRWLHFGGGNLFRVYIAGLQDRLLSEGLASGGIAVVECFDEEIIAGIYEPYDCLTLAVVMGMEGIMEERVIASVAEAHVCGRDLDRLIRLAEDPDLQMISFTITEKGYHTGKGSAMETVCDLLHRRYLANASPIALLSLDNCSRNGEKLQNCILELAEEKGDAGFLRYLSDDSRVSFPWSMIDKITPRPSERIAEILIEQGVGDTEILVTEKSTYIAPFVNTEEAQYLVVEDRFPNGRPPLEKAGVIFTDRETVSRAERMKVCTCLNPLHTALAVFGCLLGYRKIADEMQDPLLCRLVRGVAAEGLPVVTDPGILSPDRFLEEVITRRFPNPFMPDTPQRIATDTSQKIPIRFGETIKAYGEKAGDLTMIPLVLAGWCRYLTGTDDRGEAFEVSPDPRLPELQSQLAGITAETCKTQLEPILRDVSIFGVDLVEAGLSGKTAGFLAEMLAEPGAVRKTLENYVMEAEHEDIG